MRALSECQIFFLIASRAPLWTNGEALMWYGSPANQALMPHRSNRDAVRRTRRRECAHPLRRPGAGPLSPKGAPAAPRNRFSTRQAATRIGSGRWFVLIERFPPASAVKPC